MVSKKSLVYDIYDRLPAVYHDKMSKMDLIKLINSIIGIYLKSIYTRLVNKQDVYLLKIGRLVPVSYKLSAIKNPFTGQPIKCREIATVRLKSTYQLRKKMNDDKR